MTLKERIHHHRQHLMLVVLLIALGMQLVVLVQLEGHSPYFYFVSPAVDQFDYIRNGEGLAAGTWPGDTPFELSPYYSYYLGGLFSLWGRTPGLIDARLFQALLGVLTCALTYRIGLALFDARTGLVAALLLALYGPTIFYNLELTTAPHTTLLVTLAVFTAVAFLRRGRLVYPAAGGLALGLATLARPNALILLAAFGLWFWLRRGRLGRSWIAATAIMVGAAGIVAALPAIHNSRATGRLSFTTTTGPYNLYIGNHAGATGVFVRLPEDFREAADRGDISYTAEAIRYVREHPLDWLALTGKKAVLYLMASDTELSSNVNYHFWGVNQSWLLWDVPLRYELLVLLALVGLILIRRKAMLLYLVFGVYGLGMLPFFVQTRFRMAVVPALMLLATATVFEMARRWRRKDRRVVLLIVAVVVAYIAILIRYAYLLSGGLQIVS